VDTRPRGRRPAWLLLLFSLGTLASCGRQGPPLPPLKVIPAAASDLTVRQRGWELLLELAYPSTTTSGNALPGLDAVAIWEVAAPLSDAGPSPEIDRQSFSQTARSRLEVTGGELSSAIFGDRIRLRLPLPDPLPEPLPIHTLGVRTLASDGEWSDLSNLVVAVPQRPPSAPGALSVTPEAAGVEVTWEPPEGEEVQGFHLYRRRAEEAIFGPPIGTAAAEETHFVDPSARYGQRYVYTVTSVAAEEPVVESSPADELELLYEDRFPPPPPTGLIALVEARQVRLLWKASEAPDVAGYQVYRKVNGGDLDRLSDEAVASLEFADTGPLPGTTYIYRVSAVDRRGQEGRLSQPARIRFE
jgi:predicted small lipoprotein YifL